MKSRVLFFVCLLVAVFFFSCDLFFVDVSGFLTESPGGGVSAIDSDSVNDEAVGEPELPHLGLVVNGITYTLNEDGTYSVTSFDPSYGDGIVNIPEKVNGVLVTKIGAGAFQNNTHITEVFLSDSITIIESNAFSGSENLTQISLGSGIQIIGDNVFAFTALDTIIFPDSVTVVGSNIFEGNNSVEIFLDDPKANSMTWGTNWNQGGNEVHEALIWHKISFNSNGGNLVAPIPILESEKLQVAALTEPQKGGLIFEGWYSEPDLREAARVGSTTVVTGDVTFHAKWISP